MSTPALYLAFLSPPAFPAVLLDELMKMSVHFSLFTPEFLPRCKYKLQKMSLMLRGKLILGSDGFQQSFTSTGAVPGVQRDGGSGSLNTI